MGTPATHLIDAELDHWQQGDVVLGEKIPVVHVADLAMPLTEQAQQLAKTRSSDAIAPDLALIASSAPGCMLVSQTCDVVRSAATRPFVEVCPLTELPSEQIKTAKAGRSPRYLFAVSHEGKDFFADLDQVTTIEKAVLVHYTKERIRVAETEAQRRDLASALGRKRSRTAFPDDFNEIIEPLRLRIVDKHGRNSPEGRFLESALEIRVRPDPDWSSPSIGITIYFLFDRPNSIPSDAEEILKALLARAKPSAKYTIEAFARSLNVLPASTYLDSDRLDLDNLSYS